MFKIGVCEDERIWHNHIRRSLKKIFENYNEQYCLVQFFSGEDLLFGYETLDILIMDIEMEGMNGIEVAKKVRETDENVEIIFLSSYLNKMQDAFQVRAYRFLDKEFRYESLESCLGKLILEKGMFSYIEIEIKKKKIVLKTKDIIMIEAIKNGSIIHYSKKQIFSDKTLKYWEGVLKPYDFFRVHRSYIIHLHSVVKAGDTIKLINGYCAELSRRSKSEFYKAYFDYLEGK
jgi:DNA-binding LytR/AlgR family response regulator